MSRRAKRKPARISPAQAAPSAAGPKTVARLAPEPAVRMMGGRHSLPTWLPVLGLLAAVFIAYLPALHGGFIWDDDAHISADDTLRLRDGLWQIWFKPGATCQYYPLTFSVFWLEYHLWALNTLGYHCVNVLLHGTVAVLLWQVLRRLKVPGALLAGGIFALHPVCVMSVAWMTELKNVLSATLALCAAWGYLRAAGLGVYESKPDRLNWRFYLLSLVLFQLALFAKTAVSFLPATLLLITWWCGRRLAWRAVWPTLPMFAMAVAVGLFTIFMERNLQGASEARFQVPPLARILISGRSFWFYLGKLVYPHRLAFLYERWAVETGAMGQYLFPVATVAVLAGAWWFRARLGRGAFVVLLHFYLGASFLILVVVLYMTHYTFVSDHWQYFGCMSVIAAAAGGIVWALDQLPAPARWLKPVACGLLLLTLGLLTWRQCGMYRDLETLWLVTLERSPNSSMAHSSYANFLLLSHRLNDAIPQFRTALALEPENAEVRRNFAVALAQDNQLDEAMAEDRKVLDILPNDSVTHYNFGSALEQAHRPVEAIAEFQLAIALEPTNAAAQTAWGNVLLEQDHVDEAVTHFQRALEIRPDDPIGHYNLGNIFSRRGRTNDAIIEFQRAVQIQPGNAMAYNNLGNIYYQQHRLGEAAIEFQKTVDALPNEPKVRCELGYVLVQGGRVDDAIVQFQKALAIQPDLPVAQDSLRDIAWTFATASDPSARNGKRAFELMQQLIGLPGGVNSANLAALAAAEAENGQFTQAVADIQRALPMADASLAARLRRELTLFQSGQPFRAAGLAGGGQTSKN